MIELIVLFIALLCVQKYLVKMRLKNKIYLCAFYIVATSLWMIVIYSIYMLMGFDTKYQQPVSFNMSKETQALIGIGFFMFLGVVYSIWEMKHRYKQP